MLDFMKIFITDHHKRNLNAWSNLIDAGPFYYENALTGFDHFFHKYKIPELEEAKDA